MNVKCEFCRKEEDLYTIKFVNSTNFICDPCKYKFDLYWLNRDGRGKFYIEKDMVIFTVNPAIKFPVYSFSTHRYFPQRKFTYFKWNNKLWKANKNKIMFRKTNHDHIDWKEKVTMEDLDELMNLENYYDTM